MEEISMRDRRRFHDKVTKVDCWWWMGHKRNGYGVFSYKGKPMPAHRFSWMLAWHEDPVGRQVQHKCEHKHCVNPAHLTMVGKL